MKRLFTVLLAACIAAAAFAQPQGGPGNKGGKVDFERIKAEKVAFITSEVGLTAKEAEAFWPIYNKVQDEQAALMKAERSAAKDLRKAVEEGKDTKALLDNYLKAKEANVNLQVRAAKDYKKVLPDEKVAKFYLCEEKFLRNQLGKLGGHGGRRGGFEGAPGGAPRGFKGQRGEKPEQPVQQ
ncbi:MAG: hypothetical protein IKZ91_04640 [Bacteroidales bacterium]|nr:hypothetical protein [Bacteroidales bacterium]